MLNQEKLDYFYNLIKINYAKGIYGNAPSVPTEYLVNKVLKNYLIPGLYFNFPEIKFDNRKTNINEYNNNLLNIKYDFVILFKALNNIIQEIDDQLQNSLAEQNKIIKELDIIDNEIDILDSEQVDPEKVEYYFSDSFNNSKFIDFKRCKNILYNPNDGSIKIDTKTANRIDFSHYLNKRGTQFVITSSTENIISQNNLPNTQFEAMFTEDSSDKWIYEIKASDVIELEGYFILNLNTTGKDELINKISIKFTHLNDTYNDSNFIWVEYKKDNDWVVIPETFKPIDKMDIETNFSEVKTKSLKFNFRKTEPDDLNNLLYYIGIQELNVFKTENKYEAQFITKPIEIQPYNNEDITIYSAMLETVEQLGNDTSIDYYVAIDEQLSGKIVNIDGEIVDIHSSDAYGFVYNTTGIIDGDQENFKTYKSDLRDYYHISGAEIYETWEPSWIPIAPINKNDSKADTVFFNTTTEYNTHNIVSRTGSGVSETYYTGPGWFRRFPLTGLNEVSIPIMFTGILAANQLFPALPDFRVNNKEYYKIFLWKKGFTPIPESVKLYTNAQGTDSVKWVWDYKEKLIERKIIIDSGLIASDNLYVVVDSGVNSTILTNSIQNVHLRTNPKNFVESIDYDVYYYYDNRSLSGQYPLYNRATIDFSKYLISNRDVRAQAGTVFTNTDTPSITMRDIYLEYDVEQTEKSISSWNTFLYVPVNLVDANIKIGTKLEEFKSLISKVEITEINNKKSKLTLSVNELGQEIYLDAGLYLVRIFTDAYLDKTDTRYKNSKWNPIEGNNFKSSAGIKQYSSIKPLKLCDFFTLLNDKHYDDNTGFSIISDVKDNTYLVVQKPSRFNFPGYDQNGVYQTQSGYVGPLDGAIKNNFHYLRYNYNTDTKSYIYWTTGSVDKHTCSSGVHPGTSGYSDGLVDPEYPNTSGGVWYYNISTFGEKINIHNTCTSGYLFYETGENLESYYKMSYRRANEIDSNRIMLKAVLKSNNKTQTPIIDKYKLTINHSEFDEYAV